MSDQEVHNQITGWIAFFLMGGWGLIYFPIRAYIKWSSPEQRLLRKEQALHKERRKSAVNAYIKWRFPE